MLLDEPTAALDVGHRELILRQAAALTRQGRSVVSVLHDLNAAAFYADRLVVMAAGRVSAQGDPRDVLKEDLLSEIYHQSMMVIDHPYRDCPLVLVADARPHE
ncbi:MAG: hypothetical protein ACE5MI_06185 [Acidimicrobiia bacterium]